MKKFFFIAMAAVAMTFTACTDKPTPPPVVEDEPEVEFVGVDSIASVIEAADSTQLSALLTEAQAKIEEMTKIDPAKAKEYLAALQNLLKENAEKIKAFAGTGAVASVIDAVANLPEIEVPDVADAAAEAVEGAVEGAQEAAAEAVDGAKETVGDAAAAAQDAVEGAVEDAQDAAAGAVDAAADKVKGALGR